MSKLDLPIYFFHQGTNYESYKLLGAHPKDDGYVFRVWAKNADSVYVIGDFSDWKKDGKYKMQRINDEGIFELFSPRT